MNAMEYTLPVYLFSCLLFIFSNEKLKNLFLGFTIVDYDFSSKRFTREAGSNFASLRLRLVGLRSGSWLLPVVVTLG